MIIDFRVRHYELVGTEKLTENLKMYYKKNLEDVIKYFSAYLELPKTYTIIVPDDFEKELIDFQKNKELPQEFTKGDMGTACAKVLDYMEDGSMHITVFIDKKIVFAIQSEHMFEKEFKGKNEFLKLKQISINTIYHELAHVQDIYKASSKYKEVENNENDGQLMKGIRKIAIGIWKEYYACRISASTHNLDFKSGFENILNQAIYVDEKIKQVVLDYNSDRNIDVLMSNIVSFSTHFLKEIASFQGNLYICNEQEVIEKIVEIMEGNLLNSSVDSIWRDMFNDLDQLFNTYLEWKINAFDELSRTILKYWSKLGVEVTENEHGIDYKIS